MLPAPRRTPAERGGFTPFSKSLLSLHLLFPTSLLPERSPADSWGRTPCCPARTGTVMSVQTSGCIIKMYLHPKACTALNELISLKSAVGQANSNLPLSDLEGEGRRCREICRRKRRKPFYPNYSTNQQSSATTFPTPSTKPLNHCK